MNINFIAIAKSQLDASVRKVETEKKKLLSPAARIMLEAIVLESLTVREPEWRSRQINLEIQGSETVFSDTLSKSLNEVLNQAYIDQSGDWITTRDLLSAIQKKWCNIFPIC